MLRRITSPFREFGLFAGLLYSVDRLLVRISPLVRLYFYELMVQPIGTKQLLPSRLTSRLQWREIRRGDPEIELMPARPEIKQSRFDQNAVCIGAFLDGQLIGYLWLCFKAYEEDEVRCTYLTTPAELAVFDFDLYVLPEHRMGLGFLGVWSGVSEFLKSRGVKYTFSRLTRFNVASRRAHEHLGWKRVGRVMFIRIGAAELMVGSVFPYLHLSVAQDNRVKLMLKPEILLDTR